MLNILKIIFGGRSVNYKALVQNGALIVDVRTPEEYKSGHIKNSKNFPLDTISSKVNELKNLNKPLITVCRSGARSGMAKGILKSANLEVYNGGPWKSLETKI